MDADLWDERYSAREYVWTGTANEFVQRHLGDLKTGRALDLGAGEGRNAVWLASRGWQVTAVDYSAVGLGKGRRLAREHDVTVDFQVADALTWEPPQGSVFDLVLLSYLQLPGDERRDVLRRAAALVAPGGVLFVIAHDATNVTGGYGGPQSSEVCYSPVETATVLREAGLIIDLAEVVNRVVATDQGDRIALDTLVVSHAAKPRG